MQITLKLQRTVKAKQSIFSAIRIKKGANIAPFFLSGSYGCFRLGGTIPERCSLDTPVSALVPDDRRFPRFLRCRWRALSCVFVWFDVVSFFFDFVPAALPDFLSFFGPLYFPSSPGMSSRVNFCFRYLWIPAARFHS